MKKKSLAVQVLYSHVHVFVKKNDYKINKQILWKSLKILIITTLTS